MQGDKTNGMRISHIYIYSVWGFLHTVAKPFNRILKPNFDANVGAIQAFKSTEAFLCQP